MRCNIRDLIALVSVLLPLYGCLGEHEAPGEVTEASIPREVVAARVARQRAAVDTLHRGTEVPPSGKQILFGDLHVHTTFSLDAFQRSLPLLRGEGAHPPADACDFARYCSDLDFWSINDHAEGISPQHWQETKESIRQCNALAGDPKDPDVVAFLGWEWSQVGRTPEEHYGHKNVILLDTEDDRVPVRPVSARTPLFSDALLRRPGLRQLLIPLLDFPNRKRYLDFMRYRSDLGEVPDCEEGIDSRALPADCHEIAATPEVLFEKLAQWGFDTIVIPHGTTWGLFSPPGTTLDKQLTRSQNDPARQTLFEIYSGHGSSEEYRSNVSVLEGPGGELSCAEPTSDYLPCCWQAGELIRARCESPGSPACEDRVREARRNYVAAGVSGHNTVRGAEVEDWKDCELCRDCFNAAFSHRPGGSAQYALAIGNFDTPGAPRRFRFGFIGSSDNHMARPGTGFKEFGRRRMTETVGARSEFWRNRIIPSVDPEPESVPIEELGNLNFAQIVHIERQSSFFMTGGLVAAHSAGRDRVSIWQSLKRREVYGTSGDRILLWFDLLNGPAGALPMGSETALASAPRFRAQAIGAFKQKPGCPGYSLDALGPERLDFLCRGECYHPSDERRLITRIEVIRVRPQIRAGEPVAPLIEDPWRSIDCPADRAGCVVEFEDPDFTSAGRELVYYVRAIQEPTPAVNAGGVRCEYDDAGNCLRAQPCYGDYRTPFDEDCLTENEERAWSSPIYLHPAQEGAE